MVQASSEGVTLLNFAHSLTPVQLEAIERLTGKAIERIITVPTYFKHEAGFLQQARELLDGVGLDAAEWQTVPLLVNPPAHSVIACCVLAELHGRCGYFPAILRLRPVPGETPPRFEPAEVLDLHSARDAARSRR